MMLCDKTLNELLDGEFDCKCGRRHSTSLKFVITRAGALDELPNAVRRLGGGAAYILSDENTYECAGRACAALLRGDGISVKEHIFKAHGERLEPNEHTVGEAVMDFPPCDTIIGVGGGTINDTCKFLARLSGLPYIVVATAPSMDGYASNSSSMLYGGVKKTIYTDCADAIICDLEVIKKAPRRMLLAGIGDMAAKYISVCEWRISNLINDEYYCEEIAGIMRKYARCCCESSEAFMRGDNEAVKNVMQGLILAGVAMSFAQVSRPASGVEHYYSHLWEMRAVQAREESDLHGIQVGLATLLALRKYEKLSTLTPSYEKAMKHADTFDEERWRAGVRSYFGSSAESIIALEEKEGKFRKDAHKQRLERIISRWDDIMKIIKDELIPSAQLREVFVKIGFPTEPSDINESHDSAENAFLHTCDIRDKYILSRLLWDIGEL